jgi:hypothetical protein
MKRDHCTGGAGYRLGDALGITLGDGEAVGIVARICASLQLTIAESAQRIGHGERGG